MPTAQSLPILNADANPAVIPPPEPNAGVVKPSRSVAVAPNNGIFVSETSVAPVGIVPTRLKTSLPGITPTVARISVSTSPECVIVPVPAASWTDALAYAVPTSMTSRLPMRCVTLMGIVSSLSRVKASPEPKL